MTAPAETPATFVTFTPGTRATVAWYQGRPETVTVLEDRTKWICDDRFPEKGFRYGSMYVEGDPNPFANGETKRWIHFGLYNATGITALPDPNAMLGKARLAAATLAEVPADNDDARLATADLRSAFDALDDHLSEGGALPDDWAMRRRR